MSGLPMPNFMNLRTSLQKELNESPEEEELLSITAKGHYGYQSLTDLEGLGQRIDTPELIIEEESDSNSVESTEDEKFERYWAVEDNQEKLITCQSLTRAWIARKKFNDLRAKYRSNSFISRLVNFQAYARGRMHCKTLELKRQIMEAQTKFVIRLQAACRAHLVLSRTKKTKNHYKSNVDKIIKAQRFVKNRLTDAAYQKLKLDQNPPLNVVKNFIHLLNDNDLDFDRELALENLRQRVVHSIKENNQLEAHIAMADIQIGLFIKNAITFEQVLKQTSAFKKRKERQRMINETIDKNHNNQHLDAFSLSTTDKESRERLERFEQLLYLLQTKPKYLSRLLTLVNRPDFCSYASLKLIESTALSLFAYATNTREEYLLINLCKLCIAEEIQDVKNTQEFMLGNYTFMKLIVQTNRGAKEREFFRPLLNPLISQVILREDMDLDSDPISIYQRIKNEEEYECGTPTNRKNMSSAKEALADRKVADIFSIHIKNLKEIVQQFISAIVSTVDDVPYGIRVIAKELRTVLEKSFPDEPRDRILRVIGHFIYYRYLNPAIVAPEQYDVISAVITPLERKNLAEVSKVLQKISSKTLFEEESGLTVLNNYIIEANEQFNKWFLALTNVEDPEKHFGVNELMDHISTRKPTVYLSPLELFHLHFVLEKNLDEFETEPSDALRTLVTELGPSSYHPELELSESALCLTLSNKADAIPEDNLQTRIQQMILDTKRLVVYVIKIQTGQDLREIFDARVTKRHESAWASFIPREFLEKDSAIAAKRRYIVLGHSKNIVDLERITFYQLKEIARRLVENLKRHHVIGEYQDIITMIARDITDKHFRRLQRNQELMRLTTTLGHLEEKHAYLLDQYNSYETYLNGCMTALAARRGHRKPKLLMPFTRQYFHKRRLQKRGIMPKFGSYNYTAKQLYDRNVLLEVDDVPKRSYDRISIVLSMNEVGIIMIEGNYADWPLSTVQMDMRYEDLLQTQYEGYQTMTVLDGLAKVNVNLLIYLINKK
ncbi:MAG: Rho GTPase activation protein [Benjaminiella poitrasii]|nr:MAG: Rho GTPase activation protein [Benjaminiella poitrasii]